MHRLYTMYPPPRLTFKNMAKEKETEIYLKNKTKALGGLCLKWVSPGFDGVPDRIVMLNGKIRFAEIKAPKGKARALQEKVMKQINDQGFECTVLDTREQVDELMAEMMSR